MLRLPLEPVLINEPHCVRVGMIGFAMLGPIDERGKTGRNEYLDDCHGRVGAVLNAGVVQRKDYCHFTREYAYTIGCFRVSKVIQKIERWHL